MSTLPFGLDWEGEERRREGVVTPEKKNLTGPKACTFTGFVWYGPFK